MRIEDLPTHRQAEARRLVEAVGRTALGRKLAALPPTPPAITPGPNSPLLPAKKKGRPKNGSAPVRPPAPLEHTEQVEVIRWADDPATRARYPELAYLFAIPNFSGRMGKLTARHSAMLTAEGRRPGVPDLMLPVRRGSSPGLVIEMKRVDSTPSAVRPEQRAWLEHFTAQGWAAHVARGAAEAIALLRFYLEDAP